MLRNNLILAFMIFNYIAENEVQAAPEPCKELLDLVLKPEKLKKKKEDKNDNDKDKRKKEKIKQLKKMLEMITQWGPKKESEEVEIAKPKGKMEGLVTSYLNFLSYLMTF
ncbi:uncharacterized protein LOC126768754 isoform X2 [Nymphalis io]|uniref:uncharacterized protein LOC126768754 isoform X2 n=1 Tax=Inachis io TaxID=171585 RepID=UPI0021694858|nr:uncharacterized protein LOC126768754 isoform X2 [Nymphalis io]